MMPLSRASLTQTQKRVPTSIFEKILPGKLLVVVGLKDVDVTAAMNSIKTATTDNTSTLHLKTVQLLRTTHLFDKLSILDNIYIDRRYNFFRSKRRMYVKCIELCTKFGICLSPLRQVSSLSAEEQKIIELLHAYIRKPDILILYDTLSYLGYHYAAIFQKLIIAFREDSCRIVYTCTRWEDILRMGDNVAIVYSEKLLDQIFSADEIRINPRKILQLLSGMDLEFDDRSDEYINTMSNIYKYSQLFMENYELDDTMRNLAKVVASSLQADSCIIYIRGFSGSMYKIGSHTEDTNIYLLSNDFLNSYLENNDTLVQFSHIDAENSNCYVIPNNVVQTTLCVVIRSSSSRIGLLQVIYKRNYICSEKQILILNTVCNEIAIIIETYKLINQSVLLRESHHRIKNNLQIIVGMLYNQKAFLRRSNDVVDFFATIDSIISRIKNISIVHEMLSNDAHSRNIISLKMLIDQVLLQFSDLSIRIENEIEDLDIIYNKATTLAIILNELISVH